MNSLDQFPNDQRESGITPLPANQSIETERPSEDARYRKLSDSGTWGDYLQIAEDLDIS